MAAPFGNELRKIRQERDITQKELAHQLQINISYLSQLENNHKNPSQDLIQNICSILELDNSRKGRLFGAARFLPLPEESFDEPVLTELALALTDPAFSEEQLTQFKEDLSSLIRSWETLAHARRSRYRRRWEDIQTTCTDAIHSIEPTLNRINAYLLDEVATAHLHMGQINAAAERYKRARRHAKNLKDFELKAQLFVHRGDLYRERNLWADAEKCYLAAYRIYVKENREKDLARVQRKRGLLRLFQGLWAGETEQLLEQSFDILNQIGNTYERIKTHYALGWFHLMAGQWETAYAHHHKGLELAKEYPVDNNPEWRDNLLLMEGHLFLGDEYRSIKDFDKAEEHYQEALRLSTSLEENRDKGYIHDGLARVYYWRGEREYGDKIKQRQLWDDAETHFNEALRIHRNLENPVRQGTTLMYLGRLALAQGDKEAALTRLRHSLLLFGAYDNAYYQAKARVLLCEYFLATDPMTPAVYAQIDKYAREAEAIALDTTKNYPQHYASLQAIRAQANIKLGYIHEAPALFARALRFALRFNTFEVRKKIEDFDKALRRVKNHQGPGAAAEFCKETHTRLSAYLAEDTQQRGYSNQKTTTGDRTLRYLAEAGDRVANNGAIPPFIL